MENQYTDQIENNVKSYEINLNKNVRFTAVNILNRYERTDSYLDKLLNYRLNTSDFSPQDKALLTEIVNGVVRWKGKLDWVLTGFYRGDYQKCMNLVKNSMRIALYQIMFLDKIPLAAAVNESVEIVKQVQSEKTAGLVNGVLRNIARNLENIRYPNPDDDEIYYYAVIYSHPKWLVKKWMEDHGKEETIKMMDFNNQKPYVPIRVNTLKSNSNEIEQIFKDNNVSYIKSKFIDDSFMLDTPRFDISQTELFKLGKITVQDIAASLAVKLADAQPEQTVFDLCSAPGGKSFYLAEFMQNKGVLISMDIHESKIKMVEEGAERLGLSIIKCSVGDAEKKNFKNPADLVFLDVPCSGFGVIRKKPDIRWDKEFEDIALLQVKQRKILENAVHMVKPGGVLVYSTCTTEPEENEDNIYWFLENHPEFELDRAENYLDEEICENGFMKIIPYKHEIDGAFAARLIKSDDIDNKVK